jgi:diacylglycerol kinase family enzyme
MAPPAVLLAGGDLWRTCGGANRAPAAGNVAILPVDVGVATIDGRERVFVAHLVARGRSAWFGPVLAVCNAEYVGSWDVAPRSHPGDGRLDVVEVDGMPLADRWRARRRLPTGTHVPHPAIRQRRVVEATFRFARPRRLWLDGAPAGRASELIVRVEAAALTVCVEVRH